MNSKPWIAWTSLDASEWKCLKEGSAAREKHRRFSMAFANLQRKQTRIAHRTLSNCGLQAELCATCGECSWQPARSRARPSPWAAPACRPSGLRAPTDFSSLRAEQWGPLSSDSGSPPGPRSEHPDVLLQLLPALGHSEPVDGLPPCCSPGEDPRAESKEWTKHWNAFIRTALQQQASRGPSAFNELYADTWWSKFTSICLMASSRWVVWLCIISWLARMKLTSLVILSWKRNKNGGLQNTWLYTAWTIYVSSPWGPGRPEQ